MNEILLERYEVVFSFSLKLDNIEMKREITIRNVEWKFFTTNNVPIPIWVEILLLLS